MRSVEVDEGVELGRGVSEAAELEEGEGVEGEVGEVVVGLLEEREGASAADLVENGAPRAAGGELVEGGELVGEVVEGGERVGRWIGAGEDEGFEVGG